MFDDEDEDGDLQNAELFADGYRDIYIPQFFAKSVIRELVSGVSAEEWKTLEAGPDAEWYWETWDRVTDNAILHHPVLGDCYLWYLWQDEDLWVLPKK